VGQDFHWNVLVKVTRFFASFSGLFDSIALIWVWIERSHLPAQVSCQSCLGPLKLMTSQVVQGALLNKGGYGRFRGQCVNTFK